MNFTFNCILQGENPPKKNLIQHVLFLKRTPLLAGLQALALPGLSGAESGAGGMELALWPFQLSGAAPALRAAGLDSSTSWLFSLLQLAPHSDQLPKAVIHCPCLMHAPAPWMCKAKEVSISQWTQQTCGFLSCYWHHQEPVGM